MWFARSHAQHSLTTEYHLREPSRSSRLRVGLLCFVLFVSPSCHRGAHFRLPEKSEKTRFLKNAFAFRDFPKFSDLAKRPNAYTGSVNAARPAAPTP
jgi:hypothetical protein